MVLLLSASAFGSDLPSPVSPAFRQSSFGPSPPQSPTRSASPATPLSAVGRIQPTKPWINTTTQQGSRPPTPGSVADSDQESPRGTTTRLLIPPRKDSMQYRPADSPSVSRPGTPRGSSSRSRTASRDAKRLLSDASQPEVLTYPERTARSPLHKPIAAKLSLFPAPPRSNLTPIPRPILKQNRSHTEPCATAENVSKPSSLPSIYAKFLRRAHTSPLIDTSREASKHSQQKTHTHAAAPIIVIKKPDTRRPSAVEMIAAKEHDNPTIIHTGPRHAFEVQTNSSLQLQGQIAVTWVKKEEKQRRKMAKELELTRQGLYRSQPNFDARKLDHGDPVHQEATVWDDINIDSYLDSPTLGVTTPGSSRIVPFVFSIPQPSSPQPPVELQAAPVLRSKSHPVSPKILSPTIDRPHPLRSLTTERSQSEDRGPAPAPRAKHARNASDSNSTEDSRRGRTRSRSSTIGGTIHVPPSQGPLDIRKSTFRPFKPDLDLEALAALDKLRSECDMYELARRREEESKKRRIGIAKSKFLAVKPLPPPKLEPVLVREKGGKTATARDNSPLAKLANLVK